MDAHVHYCSPFSDVLGAYHLPLARGDDEDVGPAGDLGQILCPGVADGHGGVLAQEELRQGLADEVRATDDYSLGARKLYAVSLEEPDHPVRGAGQEARETDGEPAHTLRAQAVHVLGRVYAGDQGHGVETCRKRELDEEARDRRVGVQLLDERR